MAILQTATTSFKIELLQAVHNFGPTSPNTFKIALYTASASLDATTTVYTASARDAAAKNVKTIEVTRITTVVGTTPRTTVNTATTPVTTVVTTTTPRTTTTVTTPVTVTTYSDGSTTTPVITRCFSGHHYCRHDLS